MTLKDTMHRQAKLALNAQQVSSREEINEHMLSTSFLSLLDSIDTASKNGIFQISVNALTISGLDKICLEESGFHYSIKWYDGKVMGCISWR